MANSPPTLASSGFGIQVGQYTVVPASFAMRCQPALHAFGQLVGLTAVALVGARVSRASAPQPVSARHARSTAAVAGRTLNPPDSVGLDATAIYPPEWRACRSAQGSSPVAATARD